MSKRIGRTFSAGFRLETAQSVVDQGYTHDEAAKAIGVLGRATGKRACVIATSGSSDVIVSHSSDVKVEKTINK